MIINWKLWRWFALAAGLFGVLLAMFQPTFTGSGDPGDFEWRSVGHRFFGFAPLSLFGLALLVCLLQFARIIFRRLFTRCALKWFLGTLLFLMVLGAAYYFGENWRGERAWESYKLEGESRGESFDFAGFIPPPVPDDQNFALSPVVASGYLRRMDKSGLPIHPENTNVVDRLTMNAYRQKVVTSTNLSLGDWRNGRLTDLMAWQIYYRTRFVTNELMAQPLNGRWRDPKKNDTNMYGMVVESLDTNEFPVAAQPQSPAADVLLALSKYASAMEELRQASRLPCSRFPLNYRSDDPAQILFPHWGGLKSCAEILRLRAVAELNNQQSDKALADVGLMLYLANSIRREPSGYSFEVQMSLVNCAVQPVWEGLARRQWSADELAALERELSGIDAVQDYGFALRAELASNLRTIEYLRRGRLTNSITCIGGDIIWGPTLILRLSPSGWFYLNERATARVFEAALPTASEAHQRILSFEINDRFWRAEALARRPHLIPDSFWLAFVPPLGRKAGFAAAIQAGVDMARIACALERYRLAEGSYPEKLGVLMPPFIETVPHDIVNGQGMRYRRLEDGRFVLYSVGWDGQDDGGLREDARQLNQQKPSGDWVWQYPAIGN